MLLCLHIASNIDFKSIVVRTLQSVSSVITEKTGRQPDHSMEVLATGCYGHLKKDPINSRKIVLLWIVECDNSDAATCAAVSLVFCVLKSRSMYSEKNHSV